MRNNKLSKILQKTGIKQLITTTENNFMRDNSENPTAEYYIPNIVTDMIVSGKMAVRVIPTNDNWFGVTYKEDKPMAVTAINKCIADGVYPKNLWN